MMTEAPPGRLGRGNWIITHIQMLTFVLTLCGASAAALGAIIAGALYMSHEAAMIADLQKQMTHVEAQNSKMEQQIGTLYCAMAGHPKVNRDCDGTDGAK